MKISYLSTFYPFRGGIAQFNAALYRALEYKADMEAFTFKRQYPDMLFPGKTQYVTDEDRPDAVPSKRLLDSVNPLNWLWAAHKIRQSSPDLLLMKFWMPFFGPSLGYVAGHMPSHTKSIAILDNVIPHEKRFFDMPFLKYFLRRTDGFVVMSEQVRDELLQLKPGARYIYKQHPLYDHFGAPVSKQEACEKLQLDPAKKTLLFFGFIRQYKGLDLLIEAFDRLDDSYQLVIAGESYGSFDAYDKKIAANRNHSRIHKHVRYIADDEVPLFFSAADACVLPYRSATQSGITSIAYHFDLPMIATDVGGLNEMVIDRKTGLMIEQPAVDAIEKGIRNFFEIGKAQFATHIAQKKQELTWDGFAQAIIDLSHSL